MTTTLQQSRWEKDATASWWLSLAKNLESGIFFLFILLLPTQLGKHFWFGFSYVLGQRIDYLSPTMYATDILLIVLFLVTVMQRKKIIVSPVFLLTILFLAVCCALSTSPFAGWYLLAKFLEVSFLVWYVSVREFSKNIVGILLGIGVLCESVLATAQFVLQGSVGGILYFFGERTFSATTPGIANASIKGALVLRPYATFSHPNMLGGYLAATLFLVFYLCWQTRQKIIRAFLFFVFLCGSGGLLLSLSRTAIAAGVLAAALLFLFWKQRAKNFVLPFFAAIILLIFISTLFPDVFFRLLSLPVGQSLTERIVLARAAFFMMWSHPLFGVGLNNFISSLVLVFPNTVFLQPVHDIYLLVAAETGLPGIIAFCWFLFVIGKRLIVLWKQSVDAKKQELSFLCAAFFVILFAGFFDHYFLTLQQGQLLFALVIGLVLREVGKKPDTIRL